MAKRGGRKRESSLPREIRERLREYVRDYCDGNSSEFARRMGVARTTVTGWFSDKPHTPDIGQLVALATNGNINLNWLLVGELPVLRGAPHPDEQVPQRFRAAIVAQLATEYGEAEEVRQLLEAVLPLPDELLNMMADQCRSWVQASVRSRMSSMPGLLTDAMARVSGFYEAQRQLIKDMVKRQNAGPTDADGP